MVCPSPFLEDRKESSASPRAVYGNVCNSATEHKKTVSSADLARVNSRSSTLRRCIICVRGYATIEHRGCRRAYSARVNRRSSTLHRCIIFVRCYATIKDRGRRRADCARVNRWSSTLHRCIISIRGYTAIDDRGVRGATGLSGCGFTRRKSVFFVSDMVSWITGAILVFPLLTELQRSTKALAGNCNPEGDGN